MHLAGGNGEIEGAREAAIYRIKIPLGVWAFRCEGWNTFVCSLHFALQVLEGYIVI